MTLALPQFVFFFALTQLDDPGKVMEKSPIPTGWLKMLIRIARTDYDNPQHYDNPQQPTIIDYVRYIHVIKKNKTSATAPVQLPCTFQNVAFNHLPLRFFSTWPRWKTFNVQPRRTQKYQHTHTRVYIYIHIIHTLCVIISI